MKAISPRRLMAYSLGVWLLLFIVAPMSYDVPVPLAGLIFLLGNIVAFVIGTGTHDLSRKIAGRNPDVIPESNIVPENRSRTHLIITLFIVLGIGGALLRYYDLFVIKSYFAYGSYADFRLNYDAAAIDFGPVSVLSSVLFPFSVLPMLLVIYYRDISTNIQRITAYALSGGFVVYFALRGGRTGITLVAVMAVIALVLSGRLGAVVRSRRFIRLASVGAIAFVAFFVYSATILGDRLEAMGFTFVSGLEYLETAHHITMAGWVMDIAEQSELAEAVVYTITSLVHYFLHGFYQFSLEFSAFEPQGVFYGAFQYYPVAKFFNVLGLETVTAAQLSAAMVEPGKYTTFYGPVLQDFGYFGFVYCAVLGFISQISYRRAVAGDRLHRVLYPFAAAVILHSSFLNMIQSGTGVYFLTAFLAGGVLLRIMGGESTGYATGAIELSQEGGSHEAAIERQR